MKLIFAKNATSVTVDVFIQDSSSTTGAGLAGLVFNTAGLTAQYKTPRIAWTAISLVTQTVTGAYSSGGFVDNGTVAGSYRLDIPNAAFAVGTNQVQVALYGATNMAPVLLEIQLTNFDLNAAAPNVTATNTVAATVAAGGITTASFAAGAINAAALASDSIQLAKIQDGAISAAKFASGAITSTVLSNNAITAAKFNPDAITSTVIADNAVTALKIATNAITSAKIATGAIGVSQLADASLTAAKFAADAITSTVLANDAITAAKIATGAFTATKPDAGFLAAIKAEALSAANDYGAIKPTTPGRTLNTSVTGAVPVADDGIGSNSFSTGSITAAAIAADAITSAKIANDAIIAGKIGTNAIQAGNFDTAAIEARVIATDAIAAAKIATGAITSTKFASGAINAAALANGAITSAKLDDNAISNGKIAVNAIGPGVMAAASIYPGVITTNTIRAGDIAAGALSATKFAADYPQVVRDAMKLAPTAGSPASGSVDDHLNTVDDVYTEIVDHRSDMSSTETFFANRRIAEGLTPAQTGLSDVTRQVKLGASALARDYVGAQVFLKARTGTRDQIRRVVAWDDSNRIATINTPWTVNPASGQQVNFVIDAFQEHGQLHEWTGTELRYKASALSQAPAAGASLTAQEVRDSLLLSATGGGAAIDTRLTSIASDAQTAGDSAAFLAFRENTFYTSRITDIDSNTSNIGTALGALDTKIDTKPDQQEVRDAMALAPTPGTPGVGSIDESLEGTKSSLQVIVNAIPTQQEIRDSMKLAPTAGDPDFQSIDNELDVILSGVGTIVTGIGSVNGKIDLVQADATVLLGIIDEGVLPIQSGLDDSRYQSKLATSAPTLANSLVGCLVTVETTPHQRRRIVGYDDIEKIITVDAPWSQNPGQTTVYRIQLDTEVLLGDTAKLTVGSAVENELLKPFTSTGNATSLQGRMKRHDDLLEAGAGYQRYKATALELAPSGGGGGGGAAGFDELVNGTVATVEPSQVVWTLSVGPLNNDALVGSMVVRTKPDGRVSINRIVDYIGGSRQVTVEAVPNLTVEVGDTVRVVAKMPGQSLTPEQAASAILDADATLHQQLGSIGKAIGDPGVSTSTIWSRVHALNDLTQQQVTDACDDALQNYDGPTINDIAQATRVEIDDNGLGSQVIRSVAITNVVSGQEFRIDAPINGIADRYQRIAVVGKKAGTRNPGIGRMITTIDTDGDVTVDAAFPEAFQVGDEAVLVGYYV